MNTTDQYADFLPGLRIVVTATRAADAARYYLSKNCGFTDLPERARTFSNMTAAYRTVREEQPTGCGDWKLTAEFEARP